MNTINFDTLKSNLMLTLQNFEFSQELIDSLLTDDFIDGLLELQQFRPENSEFIKFIENFSDEQNLNSVKQFDNLLRDELTKKGYVRDVLTYIRAAWKNILFPDEIMTRSIEIGLQRVASIVGTGLTAFANSVASKLYFLYQDVMGWQEMAMWAHNKQNEFYDIAETFDRQMRELASNLRPLFSTAETTRSPLIVDLDGDGVETTSVSGGVYFDHDSNGFAENSSWIGKDDDILVYFVNDRNLSLTKYTQES